MPGIVSSVRRLEVPAPSPQAIARGERALLKAIERGAPRPAWRLLSRPMVPAAAAVVAALILIGLAVAGPLRDAFDLGTKTPVAHGIVMAAVARRLSAASDRLEELTCRPVEARVALALLRIAGSDGYTVSASHQVIADLAGTHRETTSRRLGNLQVKGLLRLGRCVIEITDRRGLAELANG